MGTALMAPTGARSNDGDATRAAAGLPEGGPGGCERQH